MRRLILILVLILTASSAPAWQELEPGLWLGQYSVAEGKAPVAVLRIDPERYELKLFTAKDRGRVLPADGWAAANDLLAVINASMYLPDGLTSTGLMRSGTVVNNGVVNGQFGAFLVFDPLEKGLAPVQIVDRVHQPNWEEIIAQYGTVVQNFRMISPAGNNLWKPDNRIYSIACVGVDKDGNVLFVHSRVPHSVYEFNRILLELPIDLVNAMYVEGGPEASLFVRAGDVEKSFVGSYETGFFGHGNREFWPVPNILGVSRK